MADVVESASPGALESPPDRKLIAPLWHTILLILIILGLSALSYLTTRQIPATSIKMRLITYLATVVEEWLLFLCVYAGIRARGVTIRQLINARWANGSDVGRDIGIAAIVWVLFIAIEGLSSVIFRSSVGAGSKVVQQLVPHAAIELPVWILLSVSAGFCEEFVFRGYLQEQCKRLTGSVGAAVVLQAAFFGLGHGYQGWALMLTIFVIGLLFGSAAASRKSLAPTMITHAWADSFSGVAAFVLHALHKI
jgi:uncharacterized protein